MKTQAASKRAAGARLSAAPSPGKAIDRTRDVLLDTGMLVALQSPKDRCHASAKRWLATLMGTLHTVEPVLTEAAFLMPPHLHGVLAGLAADGAFVVHPLDRAAYRRMAELGRRYADQQPDWADLALVWLAESTGIHRIATLDTTDFSIYRIHGRRAFDIAWQASKA